MNMDDDYPKPTVRLRFVRLPIVVEGHDAALCTWSHNFSEENPGLAPSGCPALQLDLASLLAEPFCGAFNKTLVPVKTINDQRGPDLTAEFYRCQACLDAEIG